MRLDSFPVVIVARILSFLPLTSIVKFFHLNRDLMDQWEETEVDNSKLRQILNAYQIHKRLTPTPATTQSHPHQLISNLLKNSFILRFDKSAGLNAESFCKRYQICPVEQDRRWWNRHDSEFHDDSDADEGLPLLTRYENFKGSHPIQPNMATPQLIMEKTKSLEMAKVTKTISGDDTSVGLLAISAPKRKVGEPWCLYAVYPMDKSLFENFTIFAAFTATSKYPGEFNVGLILGENVVCTHPGMTGGMLRVEGPGGFFNRTWVEDGLPGNTLIHTHINYHCPSGVFQGTIWLDKTPLDEKFVKECEERPQWPTEKEEQELITTKKQSPPRSSWSKKPPKSAYTFSWINPGFIDRSRAMSCRIGYRTEGWPKPGDCVTYYSDLCVVPGSWKSVPHVWFERTHRVSGDEAFWKDILSGGTVSNDKDLPNLVLKPPL